MRRFHLAVGVLTVIIFVITGQLMRHHSPPMVSLSDSTRLMFRSRHIYILASGLVNLMLGLYLEVRTGWHRIVQFLGSTFLVASPVLLILAFRVEPERGFQGEMWRSHAGLYALLLGCVGHAAIVIGKSQTDRVPKISQGGDQRAKSASEGRTRTK